MELERKGGIKWKAALGKLENMAQEVDIALENELRAVEVAIALENEE